MKIKHLVIAATVLSTSAFAAPQPQSLNDKLHQQQPMKAFSAEYRVIREGKKVGYGKRSLVQLPDNQYQLDSQTYVELFIFEDDRKEQTQFAISETEQGQQIQPSYYQFDHKGVASERDNKIKFDWEKQSASQKRSKKRPFKKINTEWRAWQDALSYQQQIKLDLVAGKTEMQYSVIDRKGKERTYRFALVGQEELQLPVGKLNTVKLKRVRDNNKRETFLWLSLEHNLALVRLWQSKQGKEQADLQLTRIATSVSNPE